MPTPFIVLVCLVIAAVLTLLAALNTPSRISLGWLGIFFLTIAIIIGELRVVA